MTAAVETQARPQSPGLLHSTGEAVLDLVRDIQAILKMGLRTLRFVIYGRKDWRMVLEQMHRIGNESIFFITVTMGFIGMILVFQSALQALQIVPDLSLLGATFGEILIRDLAASIGAMMLATRVGAGIAAEIGSMVVTEQVDALRMCSADPVEYLVVPRFIASLLMTFCLLIYATFVSYVAGMVTAHVIFDVNYHTFMSFMLIDYGDVIVGLTKALAYGAAIPIVSAQRGLATFGGSEGVGAATTSAVVSSSLAVIILQFIISFLGYIVFPG